MPLPFFFLKVLRKLSSRLQPCANACSCWCQYWGDHVVFLVCDAPGCDISIYSRQVEVARSRHELKARAVAALEERKEDLTAETARNVDALPALEQKKRVRKEGARRGVHVGHANARLLSFRALRHARQHRRCFLRTSPWIDLQPQRSKCLSRLAFSILALLGDC